jgi:hypothetical protein
MRRQFTFFTVTVPLVLPTGLRLEELTLTPKFVFIFVQPNRMSTEHTQCYSSEPVYSP